MSNACPLPPETPAPPPTVDPIDTFNANLDAMASPIAIADETIPAKPAAPAAPIEYEEESVDEPMRQLVTVQRIVDVESIPGKDRIVLAKILGYRTIMQKDEAKIGKLVAYHEVDSFVPVDVDAYAFLASRAKVDGEGKSRTRIQTMKIGAAYSQGLGVLLDKFGIDPKSVKEGDDLTARCGVTKWEGKQKAARDPNRVRVMAPWLKPWPADAPAKTDEMRLQSKPDLLDEIRGRSVYVTIKCDGQSITAFRRLDGTLSVCSRNYELVDAEGHPTPDALARVRALGVLDRLPPGFCLQAELCGPGVQQNRIGLREHKLYVFNVYRRFTDEDAWEELDHRQASGFCKDNGFGMVPLVLRGWIPAEKHKLEDMIIMCAHLYPNGHPAEGIVVRPETPCESAVLGGNRLSFKVINPEWEARV